MFRLSFLVIYAKPKLWFLMIKINHAVIQKEVRIERVHFQLCLRKNWSCVRYIFCIHSQIQRLVFFYFESNTTWKNKSKNLQRYINVKMQDDTCAPCRTLTSVPLLSIDIKAASSTSPSPSVDKIVLSGFEKIALSSYTQFWKIS